MNGLAGAQAMGLAVGFPIRMASGAAFAIVAATTSPRATVAMVFGLAAVWAWVRRLEGLRRTKQEKSLHEA